jgi:5-methylcytosine-specific restriction endonuclease McrA
MSKTPDKINYEIRGSVWDRDNSTCQGCDKILFRIDTIEPLKEISKELSELKNLKIYRWERKCWRCKNVTPRVSYLFSAGFSYHIGEIERLDGILIDLYPFINRTYSKTMEQEVIANTCIHCNSLQGNWFIMHELLDLEYQGLDNFVDKILPNNLNLEDLPLDEDDSMFQPYPEMKSFGHVHHIDGDRSNNKLENLVLLCPSCHKKADIERKSKEKSRV